MSENKSILFWLNSCIVSIIILITVGGITRLTDSGLSMVDWKPIMGIVPPLNNQDWLDSFDKYKNTPEFSNYHNHFTIDDYKSIFFWEYLHRMLGRFVGLLFLLPLLFFSSKKCFSNYDMKNLFIIFFLICIQGLMGWIMVSSGLVGEGDVSPYKLAIHFSLAIFIIGYIYWMKLRIQFKKEANNLNKMNSLIRLIFILFFLQIILGSISAGYTIGNTFIANPIVILMNRIFTELPYFILFLHILLGTIFTLAVLFLAKKTIFNDVSQYSNALSYIVIFQYFLGFMNILLETPLIIALLHQFLVAIILFMILKITFVLSSENQ